MGICTLCGAIVPEGIGHKCKTEITEEIDVSTEIKNIKNAVSAMAAK